MGLCLGGLMIGRIFASEIWGAYFWEGLLIFFWGGSLLLEFYGIQKLYSYTEIFSLFFLYM